MILCGLLFIIIVIFGEILHRYRVKAEFTRKITHILSGLTIFTLSFLYNPILLTLLGLFFSILMVIAYKYRLFKSINGVTYYTLGSPLFLIGATIASVISISKPIAFQLSILTITLADPLVWFIFTQTTMKSDKKTLVGSLLFGTITFVIWAIVGFAIGEISVKYLFSAAAIAGIISLSEYYSRFGSDNLFIPIISASLALLMF